jgi:hypothetical protein
MRHTRFFMLNLLPLAQSPPFSSGYRAYLDVYWIIFAAGLLARWLSESPYTKFVKRAWQRAPDGSSPHAI